MYRGNKEVNEYAEYLRAKLIVQYNDLARMKSEGRVNEPLYKIKTQRMISTRTVMKQLREGTHEENNYCI